MFVASLFIGYIVLNMICATIILVSVLKHTVIKYAIQEKLSGEEISKEQIEREVKSQFNIDDVALIFTGWLSLIIEWKYKPQYRQAFFTNIEKLKKLPLETSLGREYYVWSKAKTIPNEVEITRNIYKLGKFYSCGCKQAVLKTRLMEEAEDINEYNSERAEAYLVQLEAFNKIDRT